jgi:LPXTG-site transpeptidase (sortase) family protein
MKRIGIVNSIALVLIGLGIALYLFGAYVRNTNASAQSQPIVTPENSQRPELAGPNIISGNPTTLDIDSQSIHVAIIDGIFDTISRKWTLTTDKAQFAITTYRPNNSQGLTFVYGHNRKEVFSRLPKIQPGSIATVTTDNNKQFMYRFRESKTVKPSDVSLFSYNGPPILVLQTCTGLYYQNRQLFYFDFVEVKDA